MALLDQTEKPPSKEDVAAPDSVPPEIKPIPQSDNQSRIILPIEGMTGASCVARVEKGLNKENGVEVARVNLASEQAEVLFDPKVTIRKTGFSVPEREFTLNITGMTCATCVARVEKVLNRVAGVEKVEVNLANETARVIALGGVVDNAKLVTAVKKAGYGAEARSRDRDSAAQAEAAAARKAKKELIYLIIAAILTAPLLGQMIWRFAGIPWPRRCSSSSGRAFILLASKRYAPPPVTWTCWWHSERPPHSSSACSLSPTLNMRPGGIFILKPPPLS